ncbi:type VI secretion system tip protein TssI/VgrG, partial [Pseudomonas shirazensis]
VPGKLQLAAAARQVDRSILSGGDQAQPCLRRFEYSEQIRSNRQVQRDYTFTNPRYRQEHFATPYDAVANATVYQRFDYPGRYKRDIAGKPFTETRANALRHDARLAHVAGDDARLQPGLSFNLIEHPRASLNVHWRVISARHEGTQFTSFEEESAGAERGTEYKQAAVLVPGRVEWRPESLPRPRVDGPHMATVVGPAGEEIYCDEWGRVKVSFPWDRESRDNEFSSCWVRVSQGWAGGSWGSMAIPRIGQDVIIQYVNGDPDQPMITGRTFCGNQLPPYDLPEHKTRMTIKSQTHKGRGFNELRFEDELDRQEVFIHAERDQNNVVKHDETTSVGNDRSERIGRDETLSVGQDRREYIARNESLTIGQDRQHEIGNNDSLSIGHSQTVVIGQDRIESVGNHRQDTIKANHLVNIGGHHQQVVSGHSTLQTGEAIRHTTRTYEIQVTESLTITSPAGQLRVDGAGITLNGVGLTFKGPIAQQPQGSQHTTSANGVAEPGEPICLSCLLKAIADGHNLVRMEGAY